jgi:hypothetical protein
MRWSRLLTSVTLGSWLFAFFIATVHACGWHASEVGFPPQKTSASTVATTEGSGDSLPSREELCVAVTAAPVFKIQALQAHVGTHVALPYRVCDGSASRRLVSSQLASPSSVPPLVVDLNLRFVRFVL